MVLCQVRTEFSGSPGVREDVRALDASVVVRHTFQKFTVSCLALYKEANLNGEKKTSVCMSVCVCLRFSSAFFKLI